MDFREFVEKIVEVNKTKFEMDGKIVPHVVFEDEEEELNAIFLASGDPDKLRVLMETVMREADWRNIAVIVSGTLIDLTTGENVDGVIIQAASVDGERRFKVITERGEEESDEAGGYLSLSTILKEIGV